MKLILDVGVDVSKKNIDKMSDKLNVEGFDAKVVYNGNIKTSQLQVHLCSDELSDLVHVLDEFYDTVD